MFGPYLRLKASHLVRLLLSLDAYDTHEIVGVNSDLVIKPFGVKGVAVSLREFTSFALNQHHGIQANERFGWARTGCA